MPAFDTPAPPAPPKPKAAPAISAGDRAAVGQGRDRLAIRHADAARAARWLRRAAPLIAPLFVSVEIEQETASTPSGPPEMLPAARDRDLAARAEDRAGRGTDDRLVQPAARRPGRAGRAKRRERDERGSGEQRRARAGRRWLVSKDWLVGDPCAR